MLDDGHDHCLRKGVDCDRLPQPFVATFVYLDKPVVAALLVIVVVVAAAENPLYYVPSTYCYHAVWYGLHNGRSTPPASKSERENSAFFLITSLMVANTAVIVSSDLMTSDKFGSRHRIVEHISLQEPSTNSSLPPLRICCETTPNELMPNYAQCDMSTVSQYGKQPHRLVL
ncbi:hypothetical protein GQX74_010988 [Glossina fuscipes]|nr:hypothetical protein GQX74_010988 [Glossina fuscipes]